MPVPVEGLLNEVYLANRAEQLKAGEVVKQVAAGTPVWSHASIQQADDQSIELPSTTHFSVVDSEGNVVSMTSTIENGFGSRLMTNGFLLNNELTDFSFASQVTAHIFLAKQHTQINVNSPEISYPLSV